MSSLAAKIIEYYKNLDFNESLPQNIGLLHPFKNNESVINHVLQFYTKYYNDQEPRHLMLGINPGRLGGGTTGIPFTDSKRMRVNCGLDYHGVETHEPSSVFMYHMIDAMGGPTSFYKKIYINSVCPLGFTWIKDGGKEINYNYYDLPELQKILLPFIKWNIKTQIEIGCKTDVCFCLGTGKNYKFLSELNVREKYFNSIVPLEHPRYIMQYKSKKLDSYIEMYVEKLGICDLH